MVLEKRRKQELTKGEEEVMHILWELGKGTVNDIIARMPEPKPKYTTVATFIKILENKEFVYHEPVGKGFVYYPAVAKEVYARTIVGNMLASYFDGSMSNMCRSSRGRIISRCVSWTRLWRLSRKPENSNV